MTKRLATHSTNCSAAAANFSACGLAASGLFIACALVLCATFTHAQTAARQQAIAQWVPARSIDKAKLTRQGFRVLEGRHATLVTDLAPSPQVDELPKVIDAAVPLLAERFGIDPAAVRDWRVLAMLLDDRQKFAAAGLMPEGNAEFPHGLSIGYELWVANQSSDYYRRHLLLHELTHSFMATQLGGCGPGWYMEGMAELLGTHTWDPRTGKLELAVMPAGRDGFEMWGRTKAVRDAVAKGELLPIAAVMKIDNRQILDVDSYAWTWAFTKWLDTHPRYQQRFRSLQGMTLDPAFDERFRKLYAADWSNLETEWRLFAANLDYNHDVVAEAIEFPQSMSEVRRIMTPARVKVLAGRGWQSTGLVVEKGSTYELKASGRFVVGAEPDGTPWVSEPGGITLEYHRGHPVGQLLAAVDERPLDRTKAQPSATSVFLTPTPIGTAATLIPPRSGVLFLRLNDSPGSLDDNRGEVMVSVRKVK